VKRVIAGLLATAAAVGVGSALLLDDAPAPPTVISYKQFREQPKYVDQVPEGKSFILTRHGEQVALVEPYSVEPPPTTTTTTPPTGARYPLLGASADFVGDFANCNTSQFTQVYEESADISVVPGGPQGCYSRHVPSGSGKHRAELGTPNLPAGSEFTDEFLLYVPSSTSFVGYLRQNKLDETDGSCANGGWSIPEDENGRLLLRVRSDCDADHRDLDFGVPPKNQWIALWANCKLANSGGFCRARVDPDGPGPAAYGEVKSVEGDTSSGGTIKLRIGSYGSGGVIHLDEYRRTNP
jgi:hypothetical protein